MCPCEHIPYLTCWLKTTYCIHYLILFCIVILCVYNYTCYIDGLIHLSYYISVCKRTCICMCISTCNLVVTKKDDQWVINLVHWFINWRRILLHFKIWKVMSFTWDIKLVGMHLSMSDIVLYLKYGVSAILNYQVNLGWVILFGWVLCSTFMFSCYRGLVNVLIEHPNIGDIISNRYLKIMFKIPKMRHLPNPLLPIHVPIHVCYL